MEKRLLLLVVVLMVLCSSVALALAPMGPPTAGLKKGQFSAGVDYSYSRMDLKLNEGKVTATAAGVSISAKMPSLSVKNAKMNRVYANLGYGITDNWEAFLRLGGANADGKIWGEKLNGDTGFAIGFGTKVTFWKQTPDLKWGGLFQMDWAQSDFDKLSDSGTVNGTSYSGTFTSEVDFYEMQIAVGPTYRLMEKALLYGGPFFHFVDGDFDYKAKATVGGASGTLKGSYDIDEAAYFGGYIGAQVDITENLPFYIEWQHTAKADAIAMSLIYRF